MAERPRAGDLLVASPSLTDPHFARSVVLLLDSDADGALGVVLNRPAPVPVAEVLAAWAPAVSPPDVLFQGGPVSADAALALGRLAEPGTEPLGWRSMVGTLGIVDLDTPVDLVRDAVPAIRVFAGYAGWDGQQILDELDEGAWYVVPSLPTDAFDADPEGMWERVLRRQTGEVAWVVTRPADPTWN